jgi:ketosteroid isomerase-like protein
MAHTVIRPLQLLLLAVASASPAAQPAAGVEDEVNQAEERRYAAMIAGDMGRVANLLADEFMFNQPGGTIATKASLLEQLKSGEVKVYKVERFDVTIHVYGTTASVMGSTRLDREIKGERRVVLMRSLDLWVLRDDRWQLAARQSTYQPDPK